MATTSIADVWEPSLWVEGTLEKENSFAHLFNSPAVVDVPRLEQFASGPGSTITMPFLDDISDQDDAIQEESTAIALQKHTSGRPVAVALEREYGYSASALSAQRSGMDPVGAMLQKLSIGRLKRRQKALLAQVRGLFGNGSGILDDNSTDDFSESISGQTSAHLIDADKFIDSNALLGEMMLESEEAVIWMHPDIEAALRKQDESSFKTTSTDGGLTIQTYKRMRIHLSKLLVRAGTTDGLVYDTYVFGAGSIGYGAKPQVGDRIDVASLQYDPDFSTNDEGVYDRNRYSLHVDGTAWTGTAADESPTNAELQTEGNWALRYNSADRVRAFRIRTNG